MAVTLRLLGKFALYDDSGAALSLPTRKTSALLAYLAVNADRPQTRDQLATLLWGDRGERQARQSLSHALRSIRRLDPSENDKLLDIDAEQITLRGGAMDIDVIRFHALFEPRPADAAALYGGAFLDGLSIPSSAFEEWLATTRSLFHDLAYDVLHRAAEVAAANSDYLVAIDRAKRLVRLDLLRERGHQLLIRLLHNSGDRASALRQYQVCADILQKELGVEPGPATQALRDAILKSPPIGQINDAPQTADAPPLRSMPPVARRHSTRGRVAAVLTSVLILFGVTLVPWQLPRTERTDSAPHLPTATALPDKPTQGAIAERRFANIFERDGWYAGAKQAVEQVFDRRLASQHSDWDTLDCDTTTTPSARLICKDIAFEIQRIVQQRKGELDLLRQELALAVISPPKRVVPKKNIATDSTDSDAADTKGVQKSEIDLVAIPATDPVTSEPVAARRPSSDGTAHGEDIRDYAEKPDKRESGMENPETVTIATAPRKPESTGQDNGQSPATLTHDPANSIAVVAESIMRTEVTAKEAESNRTGLPLGVGQKTEAARAQTEERTDRQDAVWNKAPVLAARPASPAPPRARIQTRAEIERYWRERIEAVKREGRYENCELSLDYDWTTIGECPDRAEKIKKFSEALRKAEPYFDRNTMIAVLGRHQSRAESARHWRELIEAVKQEGHYKNCTQNGWPNSCEERAERIKGYTAAIRSGRPFFDQNEAMATLVAHRKSRTAFERYVRQRVEKLKREGPHENCEITIINSHTDPSAFTDCEERAQEIQKLWAMLYTGKAPGKFAIARAPETSDRRVVDFETERNLLQQAIVAYYLNQGYSNEPGPISTASAGVSEMQINSMQLREIDGKRLTVATEYDAETQDDFEVFSLASEFTLEKQDGVYRVVGHDPLGNRM